MSNPEQNTGISGQRVTVAAKDGCALAVYRFDSRTNQPRAAIVIAPAMAVPQAFYADFARHLAARGFRVWTFDYRGTGESLQGSMRGVKTSLSAWIESDYDAVVCAAAADPELPLFVIGHSFGGQTVPLLPSRRHLKGVVTIAAGSGAMRHNTARIRRSAPLLWYLLIPLLCPLFGYFPGARLGVIGDIPSGAITQWRRWCLTPEYLLSGEPGAREAYASAAFPVLGLVFSDDELLLEAGCRMLHDAYHQQAVDYRVIDARQVDLARIGHFGFFKPQGEARLWPMVTEWIEGRIAGCGK